jgi:hypothetical protein
MLKSFGMSFLTNFEDYLKVNCLNTVADLSV